MNPWRGLSGLPRALWVLAAASFVNRAGTMFLPFLILYLTKALGASPSAAGAVFALFGVGALAAGPLAGRFSDLFGPVRMMTISLVLSGVLLLFVPLARSLPSMAALTFVVAVVNEAFRPASLSVISHLAAPEQRRAAFALQRLASNLGMSIGPALGGFLAAVSWPALFFVDGATSLLAAATLVFLFPKDVSFPAARTDGRAARRGARACGTRRSSTSSSRSSRWGSSSSSTRPRCPCTSSWASASPSGRSASSTPSTRS